MYQYLEVFLGLSAKAQCVSIWAMHSSFWWHPQILRIPPLEIAVPTNLQLEREEGTNCYITLTSQQYIGDLEINILLNLSIKMLIQDFKH